MFQCKSLASETIPTKDEERLISGSPSAKIVSWTVHCLLLSPDCDSTPNLCACCIDFRSKTSTPDVSSLWVCSSLTLSQLNALHFDLIFNLSCNLSFRGGTAITVLIMSTHGGRTRFLLTEQNTVKPEIRTGIWTLVRNLLCAGAKMEMLAKFSEVETLSHERLPYF